MLRDFATGLLFGVGALGLDGDSGRSMCRFSRRYGALDPRDPDGWSEVRRIRPAFLKALLFNEKLQREIPRTGLRILGAWFLEPLTLADAEVGQNLALECSRFEGGADLRGLSARGTLSFS